MTDSREEIKSAQTTQQEPGGPREENVGDAQPASRPPGQRGPLPSARTPDMSANKVGMTLEDVIAALEKAQSLMDSEAPAAKLLHDVQKRLESRLNLTRLSDRKNIQRLQSSPRSLPTILEVVVSFTSIAALLAIIGTVAKDADSFADAVRDIALTVPALAVTVSLIWYIFRGRYMSPVFFSGPGGADRRFAGVVAYWKVTEKHENAPRLHVYGMFQATPRWFGLSWVEIGSVHKFRVTHVVGESPIGVVFALPPQDVGLWKLQDHRWDEIQRDTRDRAPEGAHLLLVLSDLLDDLERRRLIETDQEQVIRAGETSTWRPHVEEATHLLERLQRLADLPSSRANDDRKANQVPENLE